MPELTKRTGFIVAAVLLTTGQIALAEAVAQPATNLTCKGCVGKKDIGKGAVRSKHVRKGAIKPKGLHETAKPGGGDSFETSNGPILTGGDDIVATVTVSAPGAGAIHATGSAYIDFNGNSADVFCEVTTAAVLGSNYVLQKGLQFASLSTTRAFPVTAGGDVTINFVCRRSAGGFVEIHNPSLTALFVPGSY